LFNHISGGYHDQRSRSRRDCRQDLEYAEDLLFRIACYRDPDLPSKSLNDVQDAADFVTIRVLKGNLGAPVVIEKGYKVRVHGFLQSRDYEESLADFLKDAHGAELPVPESLDPNELRAPRGTTGAVIQVMKMINIDPCFS